MEEIVKIIAGKYGKEEHLIKIMFQIGMYNNMSIKETQELIEEFYT